MAPALAPPYSAGTLIPIRPRAAISRRISSGNRSSRSRSRAPGSIRSRAKRDASSRICSWDSVSSRFTSVDRFQVEGVFDRVIAMVGRFGKDQAVENADHALVQLGVAEGGTFLYYLGV